LTKTIFGGLAVLAGATIRKNNGRGLCLIASTATAQTLVAHHNANPRAEPTTPSAR
jgi:hypothetical protein